MILLSNHLLTLPEFRGIENVIIRINIAHVKDMQELVKFVNVDYDVFLDYPKGRTKPPTSVLSMFDVIQILNKYDNIRYFSVSNIQDSVEVNMICDYLPDRVSFVPKIETLKGVLNLERMFKTGRIKHIMLDGEDLYIDVRHDSSLYSYLIKRVKICCEKYNIKLLELYGVVFNA